jgi:hypothetical protein
MSATFVPLFATFVPCGQAPMTGFSVPKYRVVPIFRTLAACEIRSIEASPRQAAGRLHRKDDNFLDIRSLTPQQATGNALAYAVQIGTPCAETTQSIRG